MDNQIVQIGEEEFIVQSKEEEQADREAHKDHMKAMEAEMGSITRPSTPVELQQLRRAAAPIRTIKITEARIKIAEELAANPGRGGRLCKNPLCTNLVEESKNPGVEKVFCNIRCRDSYHTKMYRMRQRRGGMALEVNDDGQQARVHRSKPVSEAIARKRYDAHRLSKINVCPNSHALSNYRCPGYTNPYQLEEPQWTTERPGEDWPGDC